MNKTIKKVFMIIGILVLAFLIWDIFFRDNGVVQTFFNAIITVINNGWKDITGGDTNILPTWGTEDNGSSLKDAQG